MVLVLRTVAVITFAILFAGGCVFYPKKVEYYEGDCDIQVRKLTLESEQMQRQRVISHYLRLNSRCW